MKQSVFPPAVLLLAGFLALAVLRERQYGQAQSTQFGQKVNLALRFAGDRLLRMAGDGSSRIPPVRQVAPNAWSLRLDRPFEYDSLPRLLKLAFAHHGVTGDYMVSVIDCSTGAVLLGYQFSALGPDDKAPCQGRTREESCSNIEILFPGLPGEPSPPAWYWYLAGGLVVAGLAWWWRMRRPHDHPLQREGHAQAAAEDETTTVVLKLAETAFTPVHQSISVAGTHKTLTYREAKLLQLFFQHPNELLTRDHILKAVWEDEGIVVGRSVDMFVSRLRKILREDARLQITSVHGVGYRLQCIP